MIRRDDESLEEALELDTSTIPWKRRDRFHRILRQYMVAPILLCETPHIDIREKRNLLRRFHEHRYADRKRGEALIELRQEIWPKICFLRHDDDIPKHQDLQQLLLRAQIEMLDEVDLKGALRGIVHLSESPEQRLIGRLPGNAVVLHELLLRMLRLVVHGVCKGTVEPSHRLDQELRAVCRRQLLRQRHCRLHARTVVWEIHEGRSLSTRLRLPVFRLRKPAVPIEGCSELKSLLDRCLNGILRIRDKNRWNPCIIRDGQHRLSPDDEIHLIFDRLQGCRPQQLRVLNEVLMEMHPALLIEPGHVTGHVLKGHDRDMRMRLMYDPLRTLEHVDHTLPAQHDLHHRDVRILLDDRRLQATCDDDIRALIDGLPRLHHRSLRLDHLHQKQTLLLLLQHIMRQTKELIIRNQQCDIGHGIPHFNSFCFNLFHYSK